MIKQPIQLIVADASHAELIADLSRFTFRESFADQNTGANMEKFLREQFTREALIEEVSAPNNIFLLAYDGQIATGYARLRLNNNPPELIHQETIEIARLYVKQTSIGKGVGAALMKQSLHTGRQLGKQLAWLGVWEHNHHAINFYHAWGFSKFAEHDFMLGDDVQLDWLMRRKLTDEDLSD